MLDLTREVITDWAWEVNNCDDLNCRTYHVTTLDKPTGVKCHYDIPGDQHDLIAKLQTSLLEQLRSSVKVAA